MKTILHIDSSVNMKASVSRRLTAAFVGGLKKADPEYTVRYRDLAVNPVPGLTGDLLDAMFSPAGTELPESKKAALDAANGVIDEFLGADVYVFGVPMYNFAIPSSFKAYIDQIVRVGRTMGTGPGGLQGLVKGKKLLIMATRSGDYGKGGPREGWDFHEPYLRKVFGWLGIEDITYIPLIHSPGRGDAETHARGLADAEAALHATAKRWSSRTAAVLQAAT